MYVAPIDANSPLSTQWLLEPLNIYKETAKIMNQSALVAADKLLLGHQPALLMTDQTFYHGARSKTAILGLRKNAMFTQDLFTGVKYAFKKDQILPNELKPKYRTLFCCKLINPVRIIEIKDTCWPKVIGSIRAEDPEIPPYDGWLQQSLIGYLKMRYGKGIEGARLMSGSEHSINDEFIFDNAPALLVTRRRID